MCSLTLLCCLYAVPRRYKSRWHHQYLIIHKVQDLTGCNTDDIATNLQTVAEFQSDFQSRNPGSNVFDPLELARARAMVEQGYGHCKGIDAMQLVICPALWKTTARS